MGKPENKIESYLQKQAKKNGFLCEKFISGRKGMPDRILIGHHKTAFVEVKAPGEKPRELQIEVMREFREYDASVYVVDSYESVDTVINELLSDNTHDLLTDNEIEILNEYLETNDMPTAFQNSDFVHIYEKITKHHDVDYNSKIRKWLDYNSNHDWNI